VTIPPGYDNSVRIGYARVSTRTQDHQAQLDALAAAHCREVIVETASTRDARPKLRATLAALRPGDTLVIYKPDRVARSMKELLVLLEDQLHARGINLHILSGICAGLHRPDGTAIADKMLFMVAAMAAEMERDLIRERTLDGLRAAQAQGRRGGRPRRHHRRRPGDRPRPPPGHRPVHAVPRPGPRARQYDISFRFWQRMNHAPAHPSPAPRSPVAHQDQQFGAPRWFRTNESRSPRPRRGSARPPPRPAGSLRKSRPRCGRAGLDSLGELNDQIRPAWDARATVTGAIARARAQRRGAAELGPVIFPGRVTASPSLRPVTWP
jgi:DNA invertase Pin-like site-specific DNA recombinase